MDIDVGYLRGYGFLVEDADTSSANLLSELEFFLCSELYGADTSLDAEAYKHLFSYIKKSSPNSQWLLDSIQGSLDVCENSGVVFPVEDFSLPLLKALFLGTLADAQLFYSNLRTVVSGELVFYPSLRGLAVRLCYESGILVSADLVSPLFQRVSVLSFSMGYFDIESDFLADCDWAEIRGVYTFLDDNISWGEWYSILTDSFVDFLPEYLDRVRFVATGFDISDESMPSSLTGRLDYLRENGLEVIDVVCAELSPQVFSSEAIFFAFVEDYLNRLREARDMRLCRGFYLQINDCNLLRSSAVAGFSPYLAYTGVFGWLPCYVCEGVVRWSITEQGYLPFFHLKSEVCGVSVVPLYSVHNLLKLGLYRDTEDGNRGSLSISFKISETLGVVPCTPSGEALIDDALLHRLSILVCN